MKAISKALTNYWLKFYLKPVGPTSLCQLCANCGQIKLGPRYSNAGFGFEHETVFCICPNGQTLRRAMEK